MAFWGINCGLRGPLAKHFPSVFLQANGTKSVAEIRTRMAVQVLLDWVPCALIVPDTLAVTASGGQTIATRRMFRVK